MKDFLFTDYSMVVALSTCWALQIFLGSVGYLFYLWTILFNECVCHCVTLTFNVGSLEKIFGKIYIHVCNPGPGRYATLYITHEELLIFLLNMLRGNCFLHVRPIWSGTEHDTLVRIHGNIWKINWIITRTLIYYVASENLFDVFIEC